MKLRANVLLPVFNFIEIINRMWKQATQPGDRKLEDDVSRDRITCGTTTLGGHCCVVACQVRRLGPTLFLPFPAGVV